MANNERKARTRTLIQIGGLMDVVKLLDDFNIELGEDLQLDQAKSENAAMLLGFLSEAKNNLIDTKSKKEIENQMERWRIEGIKLKKMHAYQKERS